MWPCADISAVHVEHILGGKHSLLRNICLQKLPMYYPIHNFIRQGFCNPVMVGFSQKLVENVVSIFPFDVNNEVKVVAKLKFFKVFI